MPSLRIPATRLPPGRRVNGPAQRPRPRGRCLHVRHAGALLLPRIRLPGALVGLHEGRGLLVVPVAHLGLRPDVPRHGHGRRLAPVDDLEAVAFAVGAVEARDARRCARHVVRAGAAVPLLHDRAGIGLEQLGPQKYRSADRDGGDQDERRHEQEIRATRVPLLPLAHAASPLSRRKPILRTTLPCRLGRKSVRPSFRSGMSA